MSSHMSRDIAIAPFIAGDIEALEGDHGLVSI
jgi:hypothetical protein